MAAIITTSGLSRALVAQETCGMWLLCNVSAKLVPLFNHSVVVLTPFQRFHSIACFSMSEEQLIGLYCVTFKRHQCIIYVACVFLDDGTLGETCGASCPIRPSNNLLNFKCTHISFQLGYKWQTTNSWIKIIAQSWEDTLSPVHNTTQFLSLTSDGMLIINIIINSHFQFEFVTLN